MYGLFSSNKQHTRSCASWSQTKYKKINKNKQQKWEENRPKSMMAWHEGKWKIQKFVRLKIKNVNKESRNRSIEKTKPAVRNCVLRLRARTSKAKWTKSIQTLAHVYHRVAHNFYLLASKIWSNQLTRKKYDQN